MTIETMAAASIVDTIILERKTTMTTTEIKKALKDVIANLEPEVCIQTLIDNSATEFSVDPVELMKAYQDCYRLNSGYGIGDKESSIPDAELLEVMK